MVYLNNFLSDILMAALSSALVGLQAVLLLWAWGGALSQPYMAPYGLDGAQQRCFAVVPGRLTAVVPCEQCQESSCWKAYVYIQKRPLSFCAL